MNTREGVCAGVRKFHLMSSLFIVLVILSTHGTGYAQTGYSQKCTKGPVTRKGLFYMLNENLPDDKKALITKDVETCGVDFYITESDIKQLEEAGVSGSLIEAVSSKYAPAMKACEGLRNIVIAYVPDSSADAAERIEGALKMVECTILYGAKKARPGTVVDPEDPARVIKYFDLKNKDAAGILAEYVKKKTGISLKPEPESVKPGDSSIKDLDIYLYREDRP